MKLNDYGRWIISCSRGKKIWVRSGFMDGPLAHEGLDFLRLNFVNGYVTRRFGKTAEGSVYVKTFREFSVTQTRNFHGRNYRYAFFAPPLVLYKYIFNNNNITYRQLIEDDGGLKLHKSISRLDFRKLFAEALSETN